MKNSNDTIGNGTRETITKFQGAEKRVLEKVLGPERELLAGDRGIS
jgi:hypothetical protein